MPDHRYVVLDVGCLECSEPTSVIGLADTLEEVETLIATRGHYRPGTPFAIIRPGTEWDAFEPHGDFSWGTQGVPVVVDLGASDA